MSQYANLSMYQFVFLKNRMKKTKEKKEGSMGGIMEMEMENRLDLELDDHESFPISSNLLESPPISSSVLEKITTSLDD